MATTDNAVVLYQTPDGATSFAVHLEKETVWLAQKQMAELFNKDVRTINEHIRNIFREGELDESSVIRKFWITAADGSSTSSVRTVYSIAPTRASAWQTTPW